MAGEINDRLQKVISAWEEADPQDPIDRINVLLAEVKREINENWGPEAKADTEVALFIQDRMFSVGRKQCEDIEGDVNEMRMISR